MPFRSRILSEIYLRGDHEWCGRLWCEQSIGWSQQLLKRNNPWKVIWSEYDLDITRFNLDYRFTSFIDTSIVFAQFTRLERVQMCSWLSKWRCSGSSDKNDEVTEHGNVELGVAKRKSNAARAAASPVLERDQSNTRWAAHGGRR